MLDVSRRGFLGSVLAGGGALSLAVTLPGCGGNKNALRIEHANKTGELVANMYITVKPDGRIGVTMNKAEIGQGVTTAFATIAAEELHVPLEHVDVVFADSHPEYRTTFGIHITGGSTSTHEAFGALRKAAASAREMLVSAAAADWKVAANEIALGEGKAKHAASSRESGYGELAKHAANLDVPQSPKLKEAKDYTLVGKSDRRIDARMKVDGTATFGIDVHVPNMVNAVVIHGPQYNAKPTKIDIRAANKSPGVIQIFPIRNGVAVVAEKYWQARAAAQLVEAEWDPGDTHGLDTEKMQTAMRAYRDDGTEVRDDGNAKKALRSVATKVSAVYEAPYLAHAPMEPQNATVEVKGNRAEVWAPTQAPTVVQAFISEAIGIPFENVLVHTTLCGGGFGRRAIADVCAEAAIISAKVKRPVKLVWSREDDMTQAFYRPVYAVHMQGGSNADGRGVAMQIDSIAQSIILSSRETFGATMAGIPSTIRGMVMDAMMGMFSTGSIGDLFGAEGMQNSPYRFGNFHVTTIPVQTRLPVATWRSVGNSVTGFAMEGFVDELAVAAKQDPFEYRRKLLDPKSRQWKVLEQLEKLSGWSTPPAKGIGRGMARHFSFETEVGEVAEIEIVDDRIRVKKVYVVVDCGIAVNPDIVRAQMEGAVIFGLSAALDQEITLIDGVVQQTNFDTFPSLRMFEAPEIVVEIVKRDADPTGVGEPGLPPIAAAVANAVFALTGVRLRRMPLQRAWNERGAK